MENFSLTSKGRNFFLTISQTLYFLQIATCEGELFDSPSFQGNLFTYLMVIILTVWLFPLTKKSLQKAPNFLAENVAHQ